MPPSEAEFDREHHSFTEVIVATSEVVADGLNCSVKTVGNLMHRTGREGGLWSRRSSIEGDGLGHIRVLFLGLTLCFVFCCSLS